MELCHGGELHNRIVDRQQYSERDAAVVMRQLAGVIQVCQKKGILHRDLKPENILLPSVHSDTYIKVIDFGMACIVKQGERSTDVL